MASPPKRVKVGPFVYALVFMSKEDLGKQSGDEDEPLLGNCDHNTLTISVREDIAPGAQVEVVMHEVLHACYNAVGQPFRACGSGLSGEEVDELAVTMLSPILLQVLRANPSLLAYLAAVR